MTLRAVLPFRSIERINADVPIDPQFIQRVMYLWDRKLDTVEIAKRVCPGVKDGEAVVCVALQAGREQRRRERG